MKKILAAAALAAVLLPRPVLAFDWSDLDPFNRNSDVRNGLRSWDPTTARWYRGSVGTVASRLGSQTGKNPYLIWSAQRDGWTMGKCRTVGAGAVLTTAMLYSAAICEATTVEPVSATVCTGIVTAAGSVIVEATCTQLCHDRHLLDCRGNQP